MHNPFRARCISQPWMAYPLLMLFVFSILQLPIGATGLVSDAIDGQAATMLSVCTMVGSGFALFGLHWHDFEQALWMELAGYVSLVGGVAIYVALQLGSTWPNTTLGLALSVAVVLAAVHRGLQIVKYKRRRRRGGVLDDRAMASLVAMEKRYLP